MLVKHTFSKVAWNLIHQKRRPGNRIPVLCYHRVLPELVEKGDPQFYSILPSQFESQLALLQEEGFKTLSLSEYECMVRGLVPIREPSVLLTFDDGYADNYEIAWKIAKKFNAKINLFICPGYVGWPHPLLTRGNGYEVPDAAFWRMGPESVRRHLKKFPHLWRPLTWLELQEMQANGVQIGLHSHNHPNLALLSLQELATDTAAGVSLMEHKLEQRPRFFALPYGGHDSYNPQVISILKSFGLEVIFAAHYAARLPSRQSVFPRILITQQDNSDIFTFRQEIWGAHDWWGQVSWAKYVVKKLLIK